MAAFLAIAATTPAGAQESDTIYFGPDLEVLTLRKPGWERCAWQCNRNDRCVGWTYIESVNQCRLKDAIWLKSQNGCCTSGMRQTAGGGTGGANRPPAPPPPPQPPVAQPANNVRIALVHYNARIRGRGACIRTEPEIPRVFGGWACLWTDSPLYSEMDRLLNDAHRDAMNCRIEWADRPRDRHAEITMVECAPPPRR
ncbi:MAG: hypothetical protein KDJ68_08065 [Rhodobiaceae bacterium]|nr:hypothetical protein [Rhodobiaceae bacterium]